MLFYFNFILCARWDASSCAMDSLYDTELMSDTVPVILDNSKEWYRVLSTSMKLGARGVAHVEGVSRFELKENSRYSDLLLINRTASPLSWYVLNGELWVIYFIILQNKVGLCNSKWGMFL